MGLLLILSIYLLFELNSSNRGEWGQIKINEPRATYSSNSYSNDNNNNGGNSGSTSSSSSSSSYRDANSENENSEIAIQSVVDYLIGRKGETVEGTHDKYTYKVELFSKVEQSENWYSWNLGIFEKWDYCDSTQSELCLVFSDGQVCGNGVGRASHVHFVCDIGDRDREQEHLYEISEPLVCSYHMNMYIPQICQLINDDITNIFAANNPNDLNGDKTNNDNNADSNHADMNGNSNDNNNGNNGNIANTNNIGMIGDTSGLMNKLNDIINAQNDDRELDHLWKLCLMSLMVDDETKLNKIKTVANLYMMNQEGVDDANDDHNGDSTEICDFYLHQMTNFKQNAKSKEDEKEKDTSPPIPQTDDQVIETTIDNDNNKDDDDVDNNDGKPDGSLSVGGLIGEAISKQDNDDDDQEHDVGSDVSSDNDEDQEEIDVEPEEFQGDKVVFQSGNVDKASNIEINIVPDEEDIDEEDVDEEDVIQDEEDVDEEDVDAETVTENDYESEVDVEETEQEDIPDVPQQIGPAHGET